MLAEGLRGDWERPPRYLVNTPRAVGRSVVSIFHVFHLSCDSGIAVVNRKLGSRCCGIVHVADINRKIFKGRIRFGKAAYLPEIHS